MLLLLLTVAGCAVGAGEVVTLADFENEKLEGWKADGCKIEIKSGAAASGKVSLLITPLQENKRWSVQIPLPATVKLAECEALTARIRVSSAEGGARLRWVALDTRSQPARSQYQRLDKNAGTAEWTARSWPLESWRWGDFTGDWTRVDALLLLGESPVRQIELDDLALVKGTRATLSMERILELAFEKVEIKKRGDADVFVACDAVLFFNDEDLDKIHHNVGAARAWMKDFFKEAYSPPADKQPVALLIFAKKEGQVGFLTRLGELWAAGIAASASDGYTIASFATVVNLPDRGKDRPVLLHEAVHALASNHLRLNIGKPELKWLQEGLANYVQLCVYPQSLDRAVYPAQFAKPLNETSFFKPLKTLFEAQIAGAHYAQLASLIAYLAAEEPDLLRKIVAGAAAGERIEATLKSAGSSIEQLEQKWMEWGKKTFATPPAERIFPMPPEWPGAK